MGEESTPKSVKDANRKLCKEYPFLLPDYPDPDYDYEYTKLDDMPDGWRIAFADDLLRDLKQELTKNGSMDGYCIDQIKEKNAPVVVGLDPQMAFLPKFLLDKAIKEKGETLEARFKDHALVGKWNGHRECHILPDWLLIYRVEGDVLVLTLSRTGTHSDLFGK